MMKSGLAIETGWVYRCLSTQNMIIWEGSCNCLVDNNFMVAIALGHPCCQIHRSRLREVCTTVL